MANSSFFKDGGADSGTFASLDSKLAAAEASKVAAEAAKVAAEQAETDAQTAEANALSHANTALQNQQSTSAHVTQTTNNATGAQQSATAAQSSEDDARKLAVEPEDSQYALSNGTIGYSALHYSEKADDSAVSAAASVVTAAGHVSTASGHATTAGGHASTASGHAATAATKATDATASAAAALQSEQNAAQSETNAAQSANTASGHEANASTSENNSANSAQAAGSSASAATTSANTASGHATNAGNSATASANSATASSNSAGSAASAQTAAEAARDSALAALDSFDDRYLGVKSSDPTLDNDGNALVSGALYFSSTTTSMKVFDGSNWLNAYASLSGALIAANNLSDLNNAGTARTNLGLASVAASGAYGDLTGAPSLSSYITNNVSGDFTVDSGTLFVDAATNRVGINLGSGVSPTVPLNVAGTVRFQSTTSAGQMLELTNYSGVSKFYRSNGHLEFQGGNTGNGILQLSNAGGFTWDGNTIYHSGNLPTIPTNNNQLTNGAGYITSADGGNAATLDGIDSTSFLRSDAADTFTETITGDTLHLGDSQITGSSAKLQVNGFMRTGSIYLHAGTSPTSDNYPLSTTTNGVLQWDGHKVWHAASDGSGSGLDADTVDGVQASSFLRSDADDSVSSYTNQIQFPSNTSIDTASSDQASLEVRQPTAGEDAFMQFHVSGDYALYFGLDGSTNDLAVGGWSKGANKYKVWHAGNDGSGSGLDADTIDGWGFSNSGSNSSKNADTLNSNGITYYTSGVTDFSGNATDGALYSQRYSTVWQHQIAGDYRSGQIAVRGKNNGTWTSWNKVWTSGNDGSGSGLDADLLDGYHSDNFVRKGGLGYSGYYSLDAWLEFVGTGDGIYWSGGTGGGWHIYPQSTSYMRFRSGVSGGSGIRCNTNGTDRNYIYWNTANEIGFLTTGGTWAFKCDNSGNVTATGNVTAYSDIRLKTDIEPIEGALDRVSKLEGVEYTRKSTGEREIGFIAQDVIEHEPTLVDVVDASTEEQDALPDLHVMKYQNTTALLVEAVKELSAEVKTLKAEIEELKKG